MLESESMSAARSIETAGTGIPRREQVFPAFVIAVRAIWPRKTAAHLAAGAGVSERAAKFWLSGDREPSPEAFQFVFNKIMERGRSR